MSRSTRARRHRFVEHTGEMRLEVRAESFAGLLAEAGRALGLFLLRGGTAQGLSPPRRIVLESRDREALLVDWLNEILFLAETELWVPVEIEVVDVCDTRLQASVRGTPVHDAPSLIKAATLHGLYIRRRGDGGLTAEVVLDV